MSVIPRSIAKRAEAYHARSTGIADTAMFGPENEYFVFDDVRWGTFDAGRVLRGSTRRKPAGTPNRCTRMATSAIGRA
jgi:glutamine synthetase